MTETETAEHKKTEFSTLNDTQMRMVRTYDAPKERVWKLWNDPERIPEFWGPNGTKSRVEIYDLRVGGQWQIVDIGDDGTEQAFGGEFRVVEPYDQIDWTFQFEPMKDQTLLESLKFTERNGRTTLTVTSSFETKEQLEGMVSSGMEKGASEMNDRFAALLAEDEELVIGVDFVALPTQDLDRAMEFYGDVLGLERSSVWQRGDSPAMGAEFEAGNVTISVIDPKAIGIEFQPVKQPIALRVSDLAAARAKLESRGVEFKANEIDSGVCLMDFFQDPDGNALMLHHRYAPLNQNGST